MKAETAKISQDSSLYPQTLIQIPGAPKYLYVRGNIKLLNKNGIALVGSRQASARGLRLAAELTKAAVLHGFVTISGLARGIDSVVHLETLAANGKTIAVLAHGLDHIYPPENKGLAENILKEGGLLLSEHPDGTETRKDLFVARNRIVVGLSRALVVVEAQLRSGSLSSATHAAEQGTDVFSVLGSPGTDQLIEEGATPISGAAELLSYLDDVE